MDENSLFVLGIFGSALLGLIYGWVASFGIIFALTGLLSDIQNSLWEEFKHANVGAKYLIFCMIFPLFLSGVMLFHEFNFEILVALVVAVITILKNLFLLEKSNKNNGY